MINKMLRNMSGFLFLMLFLFITNVDSFAQQPRGRTVNGAILNYNRTTGEILTVIAPLVFEEDFFASELDVALFDTLGNVGSAAVISFADTTTGVLTITSGTADDDDFELGLSDHIFNGDNSPGFEITIRINDVSGSAFFVGLVDSASYASVDSIAFGITGTTVKKVGGLSNGIGFVYDPDATTDNVFGISANAGVTGSLKSSLNASNNLIPGDFEEIRVRMEMDANRNATFFVNNQSMGITTTAIEAGSSLHLYVGFINREGSTNVLDVGRLLAWSIR